MRKTHFIDKLFLKHRNALKRNKEACDIIIRLGYETDMSWLES